MQTFSKTYPHLIWWVENQGWIEIGSDDYSDSWVRIMDEGGTRWEDEEAETLDEALSKAEAFVKAEFSNM
ncbi:MAG TPA: hypothetical protein PKC76_15680 [Saprospiraceae bacterium]|nr:hypothetical protein [Saprospiraceae bacterium]HMP25575.1 hypothetical protein [Saprospiraceae bacterium]